MMFTFKLTVPQFQQLLQVLLAPEAPDHLSNLALMACTRPHEGIISVPLPRDAALAIRSLVQAAAQSEPALSEIASLLKEQTGE